MVARFGGEYTILIEALEEEMSQIVDPRNPKAIVRVGEWMMKVVPGYNGVYCQLVINKEEKEEWLPKWIKQGSVGDFV